MLISPIDPIESFCGKLSSKAQYYFRKSPKGKIYACRCPDRSSHIKTPAEEQNQKQFAQKYATKKQNPSISHKEAWKIAMKNHEKSN